MNKISFDANEEGGYELARTIMLEGLRRDKNWNQLNSYEPGFDPYVEYVGNSSTKLHILLQDVFWEFIVQGIIAPGTNLSTPNLPWFHVTDYGRKVLDSGELLPHDPAGYCSVFEMRLGHQIQQSKPTSLKVSIVSHAEPISPQLSCSESRLREHS